MAKPLSALIAKTHPDVVRAAKVRAEQEILELRLAKLRERGAEIKLSSLKRYVEAMGGKLSLDIELPNGQHMGITC